MALALVEPIRPAEEREVLEFDDGALKAYEPAPPDRLWRIRWREDGRPRDTTGDGAGRRGGQGEPSSRVHRLAAHSPKLELATADAPQDALRTAASRPRSDGFTTVI
jgi:hypothetical protein